MDRSGAVVAMELLRATEASLSCREYLDGGKLEDARRHFGILQRALLHLDPGMLDTAKVDDVHLLRAQEAKLRRVLEAHGPTSKSRLIQRRVLVVEDSRFFATVLQRALERTGYAVSTAETVAAGRDAFDRERADAVVCDLQLGFENGLEVLRHVRRASPATPRILMSADPRRAKKVESDLLHGSLEKPFAFADLFAMLVAREVHPTRVGMCVTR